MGLEFVKNSFYVPHFALMIDSKLSALSRNKLFPKIVFTARGFSLEALVVLLRVTFLKTFLIFMFKVRCLLVHERADVNEKFSDSQNFLHFSLICLILT